MDDPAKPDKKSTDDVKRTGTWAAQYLAEKQQQNSTGTRSWKSVLHPSVIQAVLAVSGRCLIAPILLIIVCGITGYFSSATFFIEAKDSYFAYSQLDPVMHGGARAASARAERC